MIEKIKILFGKLWGSNFIRFCMVAGLNTAFGYSLYALLLTIGLHYAWATLIGQIIGVLFNFKTYGNLVFRNKDGSLIGKFIGVYAFTYLCNITGISFLINQVGLSDYIAGAVMVAPIGLLTFILNKTFVFKTINKSTKESKHIGMRNMFKEWIANKPRLMFTIIVSLGLAFMIIGSFKAGMSGDEEAHNVQAKAVYNYYSTWGEDKTATDVNGTALPYYGQAVDNLAYAFSAWFDIEDIMQVRHTVNVVFGWLAMLFAGLLAFRLGGRKWLPAIITFVLFLFSPRFLGHSYNDLKDVNFAAVMLIGIYYIVVFLQDFPKVKKTTIAMITIAIGLATAIRIGGVILIPYFGLFAFIYFINKYSFKNIFSSSNSKLFWKNMVVVGLFMAVCGYILAVVLWPYLIESPIERTKESFSLMSQFSINIKQLFEGQMVWSNQLPWYYTPKFIFMTIPLAVIVGALVYLVTGWGKGKKFWTFLLLFCFVFPVFWITYTKANVYGGWRHSMFAYPTLVVFAGLGFNSLIEFARKKGNKVLIYIFSVLPLVLLWHPIQHCLKNHPYEYVYFNELSGGIKNAFGKYELDYYYHSTREAAEWVLKNADTSKLKAGEKINVASFHLASVAYYLRKDTTHFAPSFSRIYDMGDRDWDYAVFTVTGMNPDWLKNPKTFPPVNTVYTVKVDDVPICIVLKRTDKSDFYAYEAMRRGQRDTAIQLYNKALEANPYNEQALEHLSDLYIQTNRIDLALPLVSRWVENVPTNMTALQQMANVYMSKKDYNNMLSIAEKMKKAFPADVIGYWIAALSYWNMGATHQNLQFSLNELQKAIEFNPNFKQAYMLMAQIYQTAGDATTAQRCMSIAEQLP